MKKLILITAFLISSFALHAGNKEYLILHWNNYRITYIIEGELIEIKTKSKGTELVLHNEINKLAEAGWEIKTVGGANNAVTSPTMHYVLEREKK